MSQDLPRDFKGIWIPKEIWLHQELSIEEKVLLAEIESLDGEDGCFASNEYFTKFFNWRERKLQDHLAKLKNLDLIKVESFDGRRRVLRVCKKTIYEKFRTSEVQDFTPLTCDISHPSPIGDSIERENKEENKEDCNVEGGPLPPKKRPGMFKKFDSRGQEVEVNESEVFRFAIRKHPDWKTEEISAALDILWKCNGPVNTIDGFIEGTIKKLRLKNNFERMEKLKCTATMKKKSEIELLPKDDNSPKTSSPEYADLATLKLHFPDL